MDTTHLACILFFSGATSPEIAHGAADAWKTEMDGGSKDAVRVHGTE
jgi:hypothetical protein